MNKLLFDDIEVSQKDFKKTIPLSLVDLNNIVVSNKVKGNNETSKYFIGYLNDVDIVVPLCIILPRISGYIKYFEYGGKNMSFKIEDEDVYIKYNQIWNKIKELLSAKFYSEPIYDDKYIKLKVKASSSTIDTLLSGNEIPKERVEYACIACISVDSVLRVDKKSYPQVYSEECKYKAKKRQLKSFIDYDVNFDLDYESDLEN